MMLNQLKCQLLLQWKPTCLYSSRSLGNRAKAHYIQGQSPEPGIREYFFYVDHHGMLFQDDSRMKHFTAALKEKKLLFNFFKRLKPNLTDRYVEEFKYISLCGRERNYVRCDDRPIVFTHAKKLSRRLPGGGGGGGHRSQNINKVALNDGSGQQHKLNENCDLCWYLLHNWADDLLAQEFKPELLCMVPATGRVYHPGPDLTGGIGLISDKLSILWTQENRFEFGNGEENPPTAFLWEDKSIPLHNQLLEIMTEEERAGTTTI